MTSQSEQPIDAASPGYLLDTFWIEQEHADSGAFRAPVVRQVGVIAGQETIDGTDRTQVGLEGKADQYGGIWPRTLRAAPTIA